MALDMVTAARWQLLLAFDTRTAGAVATGALIAGFIAFDAPARGRALWQLIAAPIIGLSTALGVLSSESSNSAVAVMTVFATVAGYCVAVSPRVGLAAVMAVLALLIAQGLRVSAHDAVRALLPGTAGGLPSRGLARGVGLGQGTRARELLGGATRRPRRVRALPYAPLPRMPARAALGRCARWPQLPCIASSTCRATATGWR
jgi:hypothetical protein